MNPCKNSGQMCPGTRTTNSTCQNNQTPLGYPGDYCSSNSNCMSAICKSSVCQGLAQGSTCTYIYDCNPGLFCNTTTQPSSTCQAQVAQNQACGSEYDCQNSLTCSLGICIPYVSLAIGQTTDVVDYNGFSMACATGFANVINTTPITGTCA
jgi:hypothetical protein